MSEKVMYLVAEDSDVFAGGVHPIAAYTDLDAAKAELGAPISPERDYDRERGIHIIAESASFRGNAKEYYYLLTVPIAEG